MKGFLKKIETMDFGKICRTCLDLNGPFLSIFDASTKSCMANELISNITRTQPKRADGLPDKVCVSCISEIEYCTPFWSKCEKSDQMLRQLLLNSVVEEEEPAVSTMLKVKLEEMLDCQEKSPASELKTSIDVRPAGLKEETQINDFVFVKEIKTEAEKPEMFKQMPVCGNEESGTQEELIPGNTRQSEPELVIFSVKDVNEEELKQLCCTQSTNIVLRKSKRKSKIRLENTKEANSLEKKQTQTDKKTLRRPGKFQCIQCSNSFQCPSSLQIHMRIHTGEKPFQCNQCNKSFSRKSGLRKHMLVHVKVKSLHCNQCSKIFKHKFTLKEHMRIHTGVKPFECQQCNKRFRQKSGLKSHIRIHNDVKSFICSFCNKSFRKNSELKRHQYRIHMWEAFMLDTNFDKAGKGGQRKDKIVLKKEELPYTQVTIAEELIKLEPDEEEAYNAEQQLYDDPAKLTSWS